MEITVGYLLANSNLPGPRGNLELLYKFAKVALPQQVEECLSLLKPDTYNCPEEFAGMCGILSFAEINRQNIPVVLAFIRPYASHRSWRIREAVAMAIQETAVGQMSRLLDEITPWLSGNALEQRTVVAGLCEPKILKDITDSERVLQILASVTNRPENFPPKLSEAEKVLRKALCYAWSVAIVSHPRAGKPVFEDLVKNKNPHIKYIVKENLKKNRIIKMDKIWVNSIVNSL